MLTVINKPIGESSFFTIRKFAKANNYKKIGHTGTLDPLAEGLLLVATDNSTKLISYLKDTDKTYQVEAKLGLTTNTWDITGNIESQKKVCFDSRTAVEALTFFQGISQQTPPIFSAKKIGGVRAYKLARENKKVSLNAVKVHIKNIHVKSFKKDTIIFTTTVSRGTYIRSLVHDWGEKLQVGATMTALKRIAIGKITFADLNQPLKEIDLIKLPFINIDKVKYQQFLHGQRVFLKNDRFQELAVIFQKKIAAIVTKEENYFIVKRVIRPFLSVER